ncbi:MAG: hypothetical protein ACC657_00810, partial [Thiohalomonadales bacterium]
MAEPAKSQSIPLGNNQETTAKGRSLVINCKQEGVKVARIVIQDTSGNAPIRIPLTRQLESVLKDEVLEEWPTIVTPVRFTRKIQIDPQPACHAANIDSEKKLKNGFIYIFVNGFLWRELQVQRKSSVYFSDVALDKIDVEDQPDFRPATGQLDTRIILPIQIEGKPMTVEVGYSAVQWSWARVESMGGIAPEGMAREEWFPDEHDVNSKGKKIRQERLQNLQDLKKCYDEKFTITVGDIGPVDTFNIYDFKIDYGKNIGNIALNDLINDAKDLAFTHQQAWKNLKDYISDISNADNVKTYPFAPWFDTAVLANQYFFVEQPEIKADGVSTTAPKIQKIEGEKEKQLKIAKQQRAKWKKSLSLVDIQKALGTDKRKELRKKIKEAKDTLADFLGKDAKHIKQLVAQIDDYSTLPSVNYDCARDDDNVDLSKLEDIDASFLYCLSNELFAQLADHEYTIDRSLETKPKTAAEIVAIKAQDKGRMLLTQLVTPSAGHPLTKRLFPPEITDITEDTTKNLSLDEPIFTSKRFLKTSRRAIKFISKFITEFEKIASPKAANIEKIIVNLVTKTKIAPNLKKITITLDDFINHKIATGQFEKFEILSSKFTAVDTHIQKGGIPTGFNNKQAIKIHDLKGNLVGSSSMDNMSNGKVFTKRYWKVLESGKGKATTWQTQKIEVWALAPEKQSNVERYSKKTIDSGVWTRGILPILTMLEVWNFSNALATLEKKKGTP